MKFDTVAYNLVALVSIFEEIGQPNAEKNWSNHPSAAATFPR